MGCRDGTEDGKGVSKELKVEDWKVGRRGITEACSCNAY